MKPLRWVLPLAGLLMILLGSARAVGGAILLRGTSGLDDVIAGPGEIRAVAAGLLVIGVTEFVCGVGVIRRLRFFRRLGAVCTVLFAVDGAINGYVLFGRPGEGGTIANLVVAAIILGLLHAGRRPLLPES